MAAADEVVLTLDGWPAAVVLVALIMAAAWVLVTLIRKV